MAKKKTAKKQSKPIEPCNCVTLVNKALVGYNAVLKSEIAADLKGGKIFLTWPPLAVEKLDPKKRGKLPKVLPTFCPICGKRLIKET